MAQEMSDDIILRLILRSIYLKGHQDGNLKTSDISWEDEIIGDIFKALPSLGWVKMDEVELDENIILRELLRNSFHDLRGVAHVIASSKDIIKRKES